MRRKWMIVNFLIALGLAQFSWLYLLASIIM